MAKKNITSETNHEPFIFGKDNYRLLILSIIIVILGFCLMAGNTDIYNFRKIILAPVVVLSGFAIGFFAILKKPASDK
jgi:hypothetical protein